MLMSELASQKYCNQDDAVKEWSCFIEKLLDYFTGHMLVTLH